MLNKLNTKCFFLNAEAQFFLNDRMVTSRLEGEQMSVVLKEMWLLVCPQPGILLERL
jgi:hypothetical protein